MILTPTKHISKRNLQEPAHALKRNIYLIIVVFLSRACIRWGHEDTCGPLGSGSFYIQDLLG